MRLAAVAAIVGLRAVRGVAVQAFALRLARGRAR